MLQEEAKRLILEEWFKRSKEERTKAKAASFAMELTVSNSSIAHFRCSGDRYQRIKGWLMSHTIEEDPLYGISQAEND